MREFKFRAWNSMAKKMLHFGNPIAIADDVDRYGVFFESLEKKMYIGGKYENMQFTGFKDENGKEIYEGDIVSIDSEGIWYIYWEDNLARFVLRKKNQKTKYFLEVEGCFIRVIGNIHENTDLLEVEPCQN